jgi:c-di-GMP-binding flagellar brake protein YcgR
MMDERRRYERVACFIPVQLTVLPSGPVLQARSFDISRGGVGVMAEKLLERGQAVSIRVHFSNGSPDGADEDVLGRIAYARADEDGDRIGVEFISPIQESITPMLAKKLESL